MRLVLFNDFTPGVLRGDNVVDVSGVIEDIPHIDAQTWMRGADRLLSMTTGASSKTRRLTRKAFRSRTFVCALAAAGADSHRLHGGQLSRERQAAVPDRPGGVPEVAQRGHRRRRHRGASRRARAPLPSRSGARTSSSARRRRTCRRRRQQVTSSAT